MRQTSPKEVTSPENEIFTCTGVSNAGGVKERKIL